MAFIRPSVVRCLNLKDNFAPEPRFLSSKGYRRAGEISFSLEGLSGTPYSPTRFHVYIPFIYFYSEFASSPSGDGNVHRQRLIFSIE